MWRSIKKGRHNNFSIPGIHFGKTSETWEIMFHESCRYDLQGNDQYDINKLFGWSYGLHHNNSIRIGWRYNIDTDQIDLSKYGYLNTERIIQEDRSLNIGEKYQVVLDVTDSDFKPTWGYNLDLYFGGNKPAPHNMKVWMKRVS